MTSNVLRLEPDSNLIMTCHTTGIYDVNRNTTLKNDDYELVRSWAESVATAKLKGIIFHNNFTTDTCQKHENEHISFIKIDHNPRFNPNVYRYFVYKNFLKRHINLIKNVFVTDVSDVVLIKNPFVETTFIQNPTAIFCGDEPQALNNEWMKAHAANLRSKITDYAQYESKFGQETLLNCGIIGGEISVIYPFIEKLCAIHQAFNQENQTAFTGDMGAFNYLARTQFDSQLKHGTPINTLFKKYENQRSDCWFRHK